jgi:hypothetical protein
MCATDPFGYGFNITLGVSCGRVRLTQYKRKCAAVTARCN